MRTLKKIVVSVILICLAVSASAQLTQRRILNYQNHENRLIRFGFCLGLNAMDFDITPSMNAYQIDTMTANVTKLSPGFHIQAVSVLRISNMLELRFLPGVAFGSRDLQFFKPDRLFDDKHSLESSYIELPVLLKLKSQRASNMRGFVVGGLNPRFDLAKTYREDDKIYMDLKLNDLCYELGAGFDFYFPYFKLSFELRGSWGIFNVLNLRSTPKPEFQNTFDKLLSSVYMFSIYIE